MSETPRIVFTFFSAHTDSMVAAWERFAADLLPVAHAPIEQSPEVRLTTGRAPEIRLADDLSAAVRLPLTPHRGSDRGRGLTSLRGAPIPPRGVASSAASTSSLTSFSASRRGADGGNATPALGGVWRLLATNNREIARSVRVYASSEEARADVERICAGRENLVVSAVVGPDRGTRGWYATLDGEPVITCSRWYETSSSSVAASVDAIEALHIAVVVEAVRTIESADRRRSRTRATPTSVPSW